MVVRRLGTTILVLAATQAFAATPIGDIVEHRDAYANTIVTVEGTVTQRSIGYGADSIYDLRGSDDQRITIVAKGAAPAPGTMLVVTGTVRRKPPDEEFDFPPVIHESSRQTQSTGY